MLIDRRSFLVGSTLLAAGCSEPGEAQQRQPTRRPAPAPIPSGPALSPEQFGARGDGRSDDTAALQRCLDAAPAGAIVRLRRGAVYRIDSNRQPTWARFGGLKLRERQILELNGAELRALPSDQPNGAVVQANRVHGWQIRGPGLVAGERSVHRGQGGEWGMGIAAFAANGWSVGDGVRISDCWGDGLYVGGRDARSYCDRFRIDRVEIDHCRRNGISVVAGRNGEISNVHIHDIGGTNPGGGIDLEGEMAGPVENQNIRIRGGRIYNTQVGIYVTAGNDGVVISGFDVIEGDNSGIIIGYEASNIEIVGNRRIASRDGGREGAALRTVSYDRSNQIRRVAIRDNRLFGGGHFVLDVVGDRYEDFVIAGNELHASNRGVVGLARLGHVTFTDNVATMEPGSGSEGQFFLYFAATRHARNVYRNRTGLNMHSALIRTQDQGGDRYEGPGLTRRAEQ